MNPTWQTDDGRVKLWLGDCLDVLDGVEADACIMDPPYGIAYDASESSQQGITSFPMIRGDNEQFDPTPFLRFKDVIAWGCNNYCDKIPALQGQWYCWDKVTRNSLKVRIAECEYAWHKQGTKPRAFRHLWSGAYKASESGEPKLHPNQKPIALMEWCVEMTDAEAIFDPFMGSGTTGVAAVRLGRQFLGCETDPAHYETSKRRIIAELERMPLFEDKPTYRQSELIGATQ